MPFGATEAGSLPLEGVEVVVENILVLGVGFLFDAESLLEGGPREGSALNQLVEILEGSKHMQLLCSFTNTK